MARSRGRRKHHYLDENENHERWLVSYADFITLLFAFFVVMYSISSVNDKKYEFLSEALDQAFSNTLSTSSKKVADPIQIGVEPTEFKPIVIDKPITSEQIQQKKLTEEILRERQQLQLISEQFKDVLQPYIENDLIKVKKKDFWIELEMKSELLFLSGEAGLSNKAAPVLKKVSEVIRRMKNVINIEGHTDNIPIDTLEFPSNWDLSSARATTVVREFIRNGIAETRLSAIGYGEFHPIADNKTEGGRIKNRRVVLVLMAPAFSRYGMSDKERAKILNLNFSDNDFTDGVENRTNN